MPTISLCMIVKNESERLPRCLKSAKPYVDEIIIVDTGSTDDTVEIAKDFGARVYHHQWEGNFSKHRNQSISYASGDWFLILDADEEIIDGTGPLIRTAAMETECDSIFLQVISLYGGGKRSLHTQQRLFRTRRGIHYEGMVHNRVVGVEKSILHPIKILHHGYNLSPEQAERKFKRTTELLKKEIEKDPGNPVHHHYLSASYLSAPMYEEAAQESLEAISLAEKKGTIRDPFFSWTFYIAGKALCSLNRLSQAENVSLKGLDIFPDDLDILYNLVNIHFKKGDLENLDTFAGKYLEQRMEIEDHQELFRNAHMVSLDEAWRVSMMLGLALIEAGELEKGEQELERARESANHPYSYYHELGRHYLKKKEPGRAENFLNLAFEEDQRKIDIIYSFLELAVMQEDADKEICWWKRLLELHPEKEPDMRREVKKAISQNRYEDAGKLLAALLELNPNDSDLIFSMGHVMIKLNRFTEAKAYYQKGIRIIEESPDGYMGLAKISWIEQDIEGCVVLCDRILKVLGLLRNRVLNRLEELGMLYREIGETLVQQDREDLARVAMEIGLGISGDPPDEYKKISPL